MSEYSQFINGHTFKKALRAHEIYAACATHVHFTH
jgi:hypothetical protein